MCVPEEEVAAVIDSCPEGKREDLVFMASGCLEPLLKSRGLCRDWQTQATLYFTVDKVGGERGLGLVLVRWVWFAVLNGESANERPAGLWWHLCGTKVVPCRTPTPGDDKYPSPFSVGALVAKNTKNILLVAVGALFAKNTKNILVAHCIAVLLLYLTPSNGRSRQHRA